MGLALPTVTDYGYNAQSDSRSISIDDACNLLVVCTSHNFTTVTQSVAYGGQSLTQMTGSPIENEGNVCTARMYYLVNPPTGSNTLAITDDGSRRCIVGVLGFSGADTSTPFGTLQTGVPDNTTTPAGLTVVSATGEIVIDFIVARNLASLDATLSVGADQTQRWNAKSGTNGDNNDIQGAGSTEPGGASISMTWTSSQAMYWALGAVNVRPGPVIRSQYLDYDYSR